MGKVLYFWAFTQLSDRLKHFIVVTGSLSDPVTVHYNLFLMAEHSHDHSHHHHAHKREIRIPFDQFLDMFPLLPLPVTLTEEMAHEFSKENEVLSNLMIDQYIVPLEGEIDELTEFVPCFRLPDTKDFHAIVYWKAGLMEYNFVLVTYTKPGQLIDRRVLAGTLVAGEIVTQSVATIDPDWIVTVVTGQNPFGKGTFYDASTSKAFGLEILPNGTIIDDETA